MVTHSLSLVLNFSIFCSAIRPGGNLLYQETEDQHQLLLVMSSSQFDIEGCQGTPAAAKADDDDAACLVLY